MLANEAWLRPPATSEPERQPDQAKRKEPDRNVGGIDRDPVRWPVGREDLADQVLTGNGPPHARIAGLCAVVAHHEVHPLRDLLRLVRLGVAAVGLDVRLVELLAV